MNRTGVLRYFAFSDDKILSNFDSNLKSFLDNYMEKNSSLDAHEVIELRERFLKALSTCKEIFGGNVFVNPSVDRKRKGLVHYDLMMTTVGELDPETAKKYAAEIQTAYSTLCQSDEFKRTLSGGLQNKGSIQRRRAQWNTLLQGVLNAV